MGRMKTSKRLAKNQTFPKMYKLSAIDIRFLKLLSFIILHLTITKTTSHHKKKSTILSFHHKINDAILWTQAAYVESKNIIA